MDCRVHGREELPLAVPHDGVDEGPGVDERLAQLHVVVEGGDVEGAPPVGVGAVGLLRPEGQQPPHQVLGGGRGESFFLLCFLAKGRF